MAWNQQTSQQGSAHFNPANAFSGVPNGTFAPISGQVGQNDAFGFAPGTLNAFAFNFGAPAFQAPAQVDAFAAQGSAFDLPPAFGTNSPFGVNPAFTGGVFGNPTSSLLEMAQAPLTATNADPIAHSARKDPFASLTIADIKSGNVAPSPGSHSPFAAMTPSHSSSSLPSDHRSTPVNPINASQIEEKHDIATFLSHPVQTSSIPPSIVESPSKSNFEVIKQEDVTQKHTTGPTTAVGKSAADFLASIDISATPKREAPLSSAPVTPSTPSTYSNASMVKSNIDWAKQRDLMASFLAPASTPAQPTETVQEKKNSAQEADDWSGYNESGEETDWSSFSASSTPLPAAAAIDSAATTPTPFIAPSHTTIEPKFEATIEFPSVSPLPNLQNIQTTSNGVFAFDTSAFNASTFDTSAFDTSAFNLDSGAFSGAPVDASPINTHENRDFGVVAEANIHSSVVETAESGENVDFGGFTSTSDDHDWAAFSTEPSGDKGSESLQRPHTPPAGDLFAQSSDLTATPSRRRTEPKIHDLSSFELPSMPPTPVKSNMEPSTSENDLFSPSVSSTPAFLETNPQEVPQGTDSPFTGDFSAFSGAPGTENASLFSTTEIPAWMQSNRSEELGVVVPLPLAPVESREESMNWQEQPTLDSFKKTLVELLGTEKSAPYVWIFDNYSKNITLTYPERHELASGLIEDIKSAKVMWLSSSRVNQWHSVLTKCSEELQRAQSYLSNVLVQADMQPEEVLKSYLSHEKTIQYLSSLSKIYKVALRIHSAIKSNTGPSSQRQTPKTTCPYLKPSVLKALTALCASIDGTWSNLVEQVREMIESTGIDEEMVKSSSALLALRTSPPVPHAPLNFNCYICYRGFDEEEGPSTWQEKQCHASCANFWTHRISSKAPSS